MASLNYPIEAVIASGASVSSAMRLHNPGLVRLVPQHLVIPAAWTAANVTLQGITTGVTNFIDVNLEGAVAQNAWPWADLFDPFGNEIVIPAAAGRGIVLSPQDFMGWWALRVRSGTAAAPVVQAAQRRIWFSHRTFD